MEYIEFLFISLVLYSGISPNVSASLNLKVLHERSDGRERCVEECGQLNRFCDVEDGRSALPVPFSCGACKPGYRQEKIREQYKEECLTNSDDSFIDRIANANHKQSNADEAVAGEYGKYNLHKLLRIVKDKLHQNSREHGPPGQGLPDPAYPGRIQDTEPGHMSQEHRPEHTHKHEKAPEQEDNKPPPRHHNKHQEEDHPEGSHQEDHPEGSHQESHGSHEQPERHGSHESHHEKHHGDGHDHENPHHDGGHHGSREHKEEAHGHPTAARQQQGRMHANSFADQGASMSDIYFLGEVLSPVIRQDNGGSPVERLSVEERAPAAADDAVAATDATSSTTVTTAKSTPSPTATRDPTDNGHAEPHVQEEHYSDGDSSSYAGVLFIAVVAGCSIAGVVGLVVAGVCWYRLQKNVKAASEAEYPAYGVTGPTTKEPGPGSPGDRKLAHSAQMYHYQHQKQQMLAMEKANGDMNKDEEDDFEEENEEGDYTVYECPGLAPTGEMEVKNPLFSEETPVTPSGGDDMTDQK